VPVREWKTVDKGQSLETLRAAEIKGGGHGMGNVSGDAPHICYFVEADRRRCHTRSAQMANTVNVNGNEYTVASFEQKLAAVRKLEKAVKG
jgi:hypothetical protein